MAEPVIPAARLSLGEDAVALAERAGLQLNDWQVNALKGGLSVGHDGRWTVPEVRLFVPPSERQGLASVLVARELAGLVLFDEERLIIHSAQRVLDAMETFRLLVALFEKTPALKRLVKRVSHANGAQGIEMLNGSRLLLHARSRNFGRGLSVDVVVLDDAWALTMEQRMGVAAMVAARQNSQIWYAFE